MSKSLENSVCEQPFSSLSMASYAETMKGVQGSFLPSRGPLNADLMDRLRQINLKLEHVDNRLKTSDVLES